jgi:proteic killer suppression protein
MLALLQQGNGYTFARVSGLRHALASVTHAGVAQPAAGPFFYMLAVLCSAYYILDMIQGFRDKATEQFWHGGRVKQFAPFAAQAQRKLDMLNAAGALIDLRVPPGNQLEALSGDRKGQMSIRINRQWRVCFVWTEAGPDQVEICDYH